MKIERFLLASTAVASLTFAAETRVSLESLPPAVQAAVKQQTKDATLDGISKEIEHGKPEYEAETHVNGKSRDIVFDQTGAVLETEDETDLDAIPAAAKAAIMRHAAGGTVEKVEKVTAGSTVRYEASIKSKSNRKSEFSVNPDGSTKKAKDND
jgi:uncharacterized membrane protein YkoI